MSAVYRLALADAMHLHNERVKYAEAEVQGARALLEKAEARHSLVRNAREDFIQTIKALQDAGRT